jgi:membrane fusion protein (multidrug efflux system)
MAERRKLFRWAILGILIVVPLAAVLAGIKYSQINAMIKAGEQMVVPPEKVNVADVREEEWRPRLTAVGSVMAVRGALVPAEADGVVRRISFEPGADVKAGAELIQLDVEVEQAQLREAEAAADAARVYLTRVKEAAASGSVAASELDAADARLKAADARLDNIQATIARKTVRAPFAGKLGIRQISVGQYLSMGSPIVSLQALDPVFVEFSLPQQRLGEIAEGLTVAVSTDSYPGHTFEGKVTAVNPNVDASTRNVRVQATLPNRDARLRPGMFVSVELLLDRSERLLFIPATAVLNAPFGDSVYVLEEKPGAPGTPPAFVVQQRFVRLGTRQGDFVAALEGLKAGERVVSTGVFKLRPGMPVEVDNSLAPTFHFAPQPNNT